MQLRHGERVWPVALSGSTSDTPLQAAVSRISSAQYEAAALWGGAQSVARLSTMGRTVTPAT